MDTKRFLATIVILLLSACGYELPAGSNLDKFNSKIWKSNELGERSDGELYSPRQRMLNDLISNVLPGKTKHEIIDILGVPLIVEDRFIYMTGPSRETYFPIDYEWLYITFDNDGVALGAITHNT